MTTVSYRDVLTKKKPEKSLTKGFKRSVGRNNQGRITTRHKGGGHKRLYREIDFKYSKSSNTISVGSISSFLPSRITVTLSVETIFNLSTIILALISW